MFNLTNITVREFFQLKEEEAIKYVELQSIMNSKSTFLKRNAKKIGGLSFGKVQLLKSYMTNPTYESILESFKIVFGVKHLQYLSSDIISFFYALNWIRENVKVIIKREQTLIPDLDPDLEAAGISKLNRFGAFSTLVNLGKEFGHSPEVIEEWKYNLVFAILDYQKVYGEVHKEYNRIKTLKPNKPNGHKR